jgi:hypothetical protein
MRYVITLLTAFAVSPVFAQEVTATISGLVLDPTGAAIAGAKITVTNVETNQILTVNSEPTGNFVAPLLRPGRYRLSVSTPGFRTFERSAFTLEVGQHVSVEVTLQVGQTEEKVEVTADLPTINTENASVGKVIDSKSISQIPLNGRLNIVGLMALAPGIQNAGNQDGLPIFGITPTVSGGAITGSVAFSLDGVTNQMGWIERGFGEWPPLDGLQEFRVITSSASAEFGKANQIVAVTRGGTNQLHATLLAFNRNRFLAAKNFFATGLPLPQYNRNEFGGNVSGPILIPKLYRGRDRTFFFFNYEGFRRRQAVTRATQVATPKMRAGDFTEFAANINDPMTGVPFPGKIVPQSRLNSVTQRLGQLWPLPNQPGTGVNLIENVSMPEDVDRSSFRIDHRLSARDQLSGTVMFGYLGPNPAVGNVSTFGGYSEIGEHNTNSSLSLHHTFSPAVLSETRLGYMHVLIYRTPQNLQFDPSTVIPGLPTPEYFGGVPQVSIQNIVAMTEAGSGDLEQSLQLIQTVSVVRRKHSFKFGGMVQHVNHFNFGARSPQRGSFTFTGRYTGLGYADFALGYPLSTQRPNPSAIRNKFAQNRYQFFAQDDYRIGSGITLNYGVRYEAQILRPQVYGFAAMFVPDVRNVVVFADQLPKDAIPRLVDAFQLPLASQVNLPSYMMDYLGQDKNNIAPRFGLAVKLTPKAVFRSGFGLYYNVLNLNWTEQAAFQMPFATVETFEQGSGSAPTFTMSNPFPGTGSIPGNPDAALLSRPRTPYNLQWSGTLEYQLPSSIGARVSYLGQRNIATLATVPRNAVSPAPGAIQPRRPYQPFANINQFNTPAFQSTAHQWQAGLEKRYGSGLLLSAEYQFIRAIGTETFMDPFLWNDSRGNLAGIRRHVLVSSYVYDLPFGKARRWFGDARGVSNALAGGWQLAGIIQAASGSPFSPAFATTVQGSVGGRPNVVPGAALYPEERTIARWFNPAAFVQPPEFTFGNAGYNQLWGPGLFTWDASLVKGFAIRERGLLQIRLEAFSALNNPQFSNPNSTITNPTVVGTIASAGGSRTVQIGAKLQVLIFSNLVSPGEPTGLSG